MKEWSEYKIQQQIEDNYKHKGKIKTKEQNTDNMNFNKKRTAEAPEEIVPLFY